MKRLFLIPLLTALAAAFLLTGCAQPKTGVIRIGVMYSTDIVPLAVMLDKKMDEAQGFALDMQVFSSAKDRDAALQAGELDAVFTDLVGVCIYRNAGLDMRITGATDGDYYLLAGAHTGITSLEDAAGRSIAISENTQIEFALDTILERAGFDPTYLDKTVVPRIPDRVEMLSGGKVDLALLPDPFAALAVWDGALLLSSANTVGLYPAYCAFTGEFLKNSGPLVRQFYAAFDQAVDYVNNTPLSEYESLVIEGAGYPEALRGGISLPVFRKRTPPDPADIELALQWAVSKGLADGLIGASVSDFIAGQP